MKILFARTMRYLPDAVGGVAASTHELCAMLRDSGVAAAVLAAARKRPHPAREIRRWLAPGKVERDEALGYPVYRAERPLRAVEAVLAAERPTAVVVQLGRMVPLARACLERACPTLLYMRNLALSELGGELFTHPRLAYVTNSGFMAAALQERLGFAPPVIPPLVLPDRYRTATSRAVVTFVNPTPIKGLEIALALAERRPDIPFEFVESWALRPRPLRELRRRLAPLANVRLTRATLDMRAVYARSRLLLAPSRWEEPWGRVVTEAQLSGIPVLATCSGGLPEAVGPGGILVPPEAPVEAWAGALGRLWDDAAAYDELSRRALQHAARPEIQPERLLAGLVEQVRALAGAAAAS
ncbi:MAG: glycosyltransferase [Dongiaceae bacterium]